MKDLTKLSAHYMNGQDGASKFSRWNIDFSKVVHWNDLTNIQIIHLDYCFWRNPSGFYLQHVDWVQGAQRTITKKVGQK